MTLEKTILTPQEVAEYLQLTPDTIYRYIREGKLAAAKFGRHYRIPKENVDLFLSLQPQVVPACAISPPRR